jgi:hypothetical protein
LIAFLVLLILVTDRMPSRAADYEQQQGSATLRVQADRVEAGQPEIRLSGELLITMSLEGAPGLEIQLPERLTPPTDWELGRKETPERAALPGHRVRWEQRFHLKPARAGELLLALAQLKFREDPDLDQWQEVTWKPFTVRVTTEIANADLSELRDVTLPEEVPSAPSWSLPFYWIASIAGLLILLLGGWKFLWRHQRQQATLPPDQWALRELDRLQALPLTAEAEVEHFHLALSETVRRYVQSRFHLPALEQTTAEFLKGMGQSPELTAEQQAVLRDLMEHWDLVKFARAYPTPEECLALAESAREFVKQTAVPRTAKAAKDDEKDQLESPVSQA